MSALWEEKATTRRSQTVVSSLMHIFTAKYTTIVAAYRVIIVAHPVTAHQMMPVMWRLRLCVLADAITQTASNKVAFWLSPWIGTGVDPYSGKAASCSDIRKAEFWWCLKSNRGSSNSSDSWSTFHNLVLVQVSWDIICNLATDAWSHVPIEWHTPLHSGCHNVPIDL